MSERTPSPRPNRRLLLGVAGAAGVLVGGLLVASSSGPGDDVAVTVAPRSDRPPVQTTTVTVPHPSADAVLAPATPLDPFAQVVTVPDAPQGQPAAPSQAAAAQAAPAATSSAQRVQARPSPAPSAAAPAAAAQPVQATQPPPATVTPPAAQASALPAPMVSATAGPVPVPGVPLLVCVNTGLLTCSATPPATSVSLSASAAVTPGAISAPTVAFGACSNGRGVALVVNGGSAGAAVTSHVTVAVSGAPTDIPIAVPPVGPGGTAIISACVGPGVGVPTVPGSGLPLLGDVVGSLLQPLLGLLGGGPVAS